MNKTSFNVLRVGLAITFLWIGILILKEPEVWGGYISPWMVKLLPISVVQVMISTALLDIAIGALLLFDMFVWLAALMGSLHLLMVLAVSGITDVTVRDIAIVAGTAALFFESAPEFIKNKFSKKPAQ